MANLKRGDKCVIVRLSKNWTWYEQRKRLYGKKVEVVTDPLDKLTGGYVAGVVRLLGRVPGVGWKGMQIHVKAILRKI